MVPAISKDDRITDAPNEDHQSKVEKLAVTNIAVNSTMAKSVTTHNANYSISTIWSPQNRTIRSTSAASLSSQVWHGAKPFKIIQEIDKAILDLPITWVHFYPSFVYSSAMSSNLLINVVSTIIKNKAA